MKKLAALCVVLCFAIAAGACGPARTASVAAEKNSLYAVFQAKNKDDADLDKKLDQACAILLNRLKAVEMPSAKAERQNGDQIRIEIPAVSNPEDAFSLIGTTAKLEFVDPDGNVIMTGEHIKTAKAIQTNHRWAVDFTLDEEGRKSFADLTGKLIAKPLTIRLDGTVIETPNVNAPITGGEAYLTGKFTQDTAEQLAMLLQSGALPLDLEIVQSGTIGK